MELDGLKRGLQFFEENQVEVASLVTDRHRSVAKYLREEQDLIHYYDVWHVAKGVTKMLQQLAKKMTCSEVSAWSKSISNHLYWVAASSKEDPEEVILAKWLSEANHIMNRHTHDSVHYPKCQHGDLPTSGKRKKWLKPSTEACEKTVDIITNIGLQRDIKKLSPYHQTSSVEGFHSVVIHFAPKMTHLGYKGMKSRLHLAALHYNENASRAQSRCKDGSERYAVKFPKHKKGGYTVCKILSEATHGVYIYFFIP
ncbi:hypothetical protein BSL78_09824 [Apostichopus japonicus]|uniref:Uncharacterized protein n=1 Tax=Stichopus japonicus TaxID=307972 RepID=A0A2G8KZ54_STIJA|nr:hypothetical protein BSL78_09824 [Apostichopus japonicus]